MKKIKDIKIVILAVILTVFTISYFVIANKLSYAFVVDYDVEEIYDNKISLIQKCANKYGEDHLEEFNEDGTIYITVQDLVNKGYIVSASGGIVVNPVNSKEPLNSKKIRIKNTNGKINSEIYS